NPRRDGNFWAASSRGIAAPPRSADPFLVKPCYQRLPRRCSGISNDRIGPNRSKQSDSEMIDPVSYLVASGNRETAVCRQKVAHGMSKSSKECEGRSSASVPNSAGMITALELVKADTKHSCDKAKNRILSRVLAGPDVCGQRFGRNSIDRWRNNRFRKTA